MTTQESAIYDLLGRTVSVTDVLGRVTAYAYSGDGLTATRTAPPEPRSSRAARRTER